MIPAALAAQVGDAAYSEPTLTIALVSAVAVITAAIAPALITRRDLRAARSAAERAVYASTPNGGGSAYDAMMREVRQIRQDQSLIRGDVSDVRADLARHLADSRVYIAAVRDQHPDLPDWPERPDGL